MCFTQTSTKSDCISNTYGYKLEIKENRYFIKFDNHLMFVLQNNKEIFIKFNFIERFIKE